MGSEHGGGGGKIFVVVLFVLVIIGLAFFIFGDSFGPTKELYSKVTSGFSDIRESTGIKSNTQENRNLIVAPETVDWCKTQELMVGDSQEDAIRDRILGWDSVDACCVKEITGYSCALQSTSVVRMCYTSNIGGVVKYVTINGYYGDINKYTDYITDLDKYAITNKVCDLEKYPSKLLGDIQ